MGAKVLPPLLTLVLTGGTGTEWGGVPTGLFAADPLKIAG